MAESILARLAGEDAPRASAERPTRTPNGVLAIPYNAHFDPNADKFLPWFWQRLKDDGLVSLYYPGQEETGFALFVKLLSNAPQTQVALVVPNNVEGLPDGEPIGFVSWEPGLFGKPNAATAGFIFLKRFWDSKHTTDAANSVMRLWFEQLEMELVVGVIATANIAAQRFMPRVGWAKMGILPNMTSFTGKECDASLWYITRDMWKVGK